MKRVFLLRIIAICLLLACMMNPLAAGFAESSAGNSESEDNSLLVRFISFMNYWNGGLQDEMLSLCAPEWLNKKENPWLSLQGYLENMKPDSCTPMMISGTDADETRTVTSTGQMRLINEKSSWKYKMKITMVKENNVWYVDPETIEINKAEGPELNLNGELQDGYTYRGPTEITVALMCAIAATWLCRVR